MLGVSVGRAIDMLQTMSRKSAKIVSQEDKPEEENEAQ
jgi:hypothetical protein